MTLSCGRKEVNEKSPTNAKAPSHLLWDKLLKKNVLEDGLVDYHTFSTEVDFSNYLNILKNSHPDLSWSREERLAFWINAYNAFTIKLILDNYPIKSIRDISGPWSKEFIEIEGNFYSLGDIEHSVLRKLYDEPRIHFAINCASFSCPQLSRDAYSSQNIESQLDKAARLFVNDPKRNRIDSDKAKVSKIFSWFKRDFTNSSSLKDYLKKYSTVEITEATKIEYLEYNWELNDVIQ